MLHYYNKIFKLAVCRTHEREEMFLTINRNVVCSYYRHVVLLYQTDIHTLVGRCYSGY